MIDINDPIIGYDIDQALYFRLRQEEERQLNKSQGKMKMDDLFP